MESTRDFGSRQAYRHPAQWRPGGGLYGCHAKVYRWRYSPADPYRWWREDALERHLHSGNKLVEGPARPRQRTMQLTSDIGLLFVLEHCWLRTDAILQPGN